MAFRLVLLVVPSLSPSVTWMYVSVFRAAQLDMNRYVTRLILFRKSLLVTFLAKEIFHCPLVLDVVSCVYIFVQKMLLE